MIKAILDVLAPTTCLQCKREGPILCDGCLPQVLDPLVIPSRCFLCHALTDNFSTCRKCRKQTPLTRVRVGTAYTQIPKELVSSLKFGPDRTVANIIAGWLYETGSIESVDIISWVPTARTRVRQRGFDHAKYIAHGLSNRHNLPSYELLLRLGNSRQVGASKTQRKQQVEGMFESKNLSQLHGKRILLVDDIVTTGATLTECARVLRRNGAKQVEAIAFAQKI